MTKIINVSENISIQTVVAFTKNGDEIVLEENGKPIAKITPIENSKEIKKRTAGLGKGYFMSDDFDDELPDEFWGFDKEL